MNDNVVSYVKDVLRYSLFSSTNQNSEYDVRLINKGLVFIPIYPITFTVDEHLYNKIYSILSVALTPQYSLIRPLTMQIITFNSGAPEYYYVDYGGPKR